MRCKITTFSSTNQIFLVILHAKHYISTRNDPKRNKNGTKTEQKRNANNLKAMKKLKKLLGLPLVYAGVAILLLGYVSGLTRHNAVLVVGLLFVLAGAASYVWKERRQSRY